MTISSTNNRMDYTGNGSTLSYSYTYRIFAQTDLEVTVRNPDTEVETVLTLTTHYTVSGVGAAAGGSIALVAGAFAWIDGSSKFETGWLLTIRRVRPLTQTTDIRNQGEFFPETHEDAFDHFIMVAQQLQEEIDRSVQTDVTDPDTASDLLASLDADVAAAAASASAAASSASSASTSASTATTQAAAAVVSASAAAASAAAAGGTVSVTQSSHGFSVGNLIYFNGTIFVKAVATSVAAAEVVGIVSTVTDSNNFIYTLPGRVITGLSGLTAGVIYYLSTSSAGATQTSKPTVAGQVIKTIMVALSTTSAIFLDQYSDLIASAVSTKFIQGAIADLSATLGTVDYTSAGIGTPKGAIITISINTADYATWAMYDQDGAGKCMESNAGVVSTTTSTELEISTAGGQQTGAVSMITDGIRIAYTKVSSPTGTATLNILLIY